MSERESGMTVVDVLVFVVFVVVIVFVLAYAMKVLDMFGVIAGMLGQNLWGYIGVVFTISNSVGYALLLGAALLLVALVYAYIRGEE